MLSWPLGGATAPVSSRHARPQAAKSRLERLLQVFAQTPLGGKLFIRVQGRRARPSGVVRNVQCNPDVADYSGYAKYQRRAGDRVIPVVVLQPPS